MLDRFIEIPDFTHFFKYIVFIRNDKNILEKHIKDKITVSAGIKINCIVDAVASGKDRGHFP